MKVVNNHFFLYALLLQLVLAFTSFGQKYNLKFKHLGMYDGLSQSTILCIFQDSRGFMWFGRLYQQTNQSGRSCNATRKMGYKTQKDRMKPMEVQHAAITTELEEVTQF